MGEICAQGNNLSSHATSVDEFKMFVLVLVLVSMDLLWEQRRWSSESKTLVLFDSLQGEVYLLT